MILKRKGYVKVGFVLALCMVICGMMMSGLLRSKASGVSQNAEVVVEHPTIYYMTNWSNTNAQYQVNDGSWTGTPGQLMMDAEFPGFKKITIGTEITDTINICFNDGEGNWDNNAEKNYNLSGSSVYTVMGGRIFKFAPNEIRDNMVTIFYETDWDSTFMHFQVEGNKWTTAPGSRMMDSNYTGYKTLTTNIGFETSMKVCFNNGQTEWDNNNGSNYKIVEPGTYTIKDGVITKGEPQVKMNRTAVVFYRSKWENGNIHYKLEGGEWTKSPGVPMSHYDYQNGYEKYVVNIDMGTADSITACFNDGKGNWDNNNGKNYELKVYDKSNSVQTYYIEDGKIYLYGQE